MATLNLQVAATADDGHSYIGLAFITYQVLFGNVSGYSTPSFARFTGVTIPPGATITAATLTWTAMVTQTSIAVAMKVHAAAADNQAAPTSLATHAAIPRTTAFVAYDGNGATGWTIESIYSPSDLGSVIQEVINRAGWVSGNALVILTDNNGSSDSASRQAYDYQNSTSKAAKLDITYSVASPLAGPLVGGKLVGGILSGRLAA
jgi:hypothetical protein